MAETIVSPAESAVNFGVRNGRFGFRNGTKTNGYEQQCKSHAKEMNRAADAGANPANHPEFQLEVEKTKLSDEMDFPSGQEKWARHCEDGY